MKYSGLYFISNPGTSLDASLHVVNSLVNGLESHFPFATRQNPWSLIHRLLRSVPPPAAKPDAGNAPLPALTHQHVLGLSYLSQSQTYCYIQTSTSTPSSQPPHNQVVKGEPVSRAATPQPAHDAASSASSPGTIISIPTAQSESHIALLATHLSALWTFRQTLQIPQGITYHVGQFVIRVGEIRASRSGAQSGSVLSPGVVCCITTVAGTSDDIDGEGYETEFDSGHTSVTEDGRMEDEDEDENVDLDDAEKLIRGFWETLREGMDFGRAEVREVMMGKHGLKGNGQKEAVVRMWGEVLKLRG
ncbi:mediator complex, subunit Med20 [Massariosphaeria phaeospora]|uniref:Mediator of RNA polymerase II transcription subunit 20 n=1 Tax=Massariosphaeria phaeospora TaxID=100035 RepID=A0A7C8MEL3_9PLEO|nr:mediator complex, subunit Med20 [Massariosphaeria phaeospora]